MLLQVQITGDHDSWAVLFLYSRRTTFGFADEIGNFNGTVVQVLCERDHALLPCDGECGGDQYDELASSSTRQQIRAQQDVHQTSGTEVS